MEISSVIVGIILAGTVLYFAIHLITPYLRRKALEKWLMDEIEDTGLLATTPEGIFEHNFRVILREDPRQAAGYLHRWVMKAIQEGKQPRKVNVRRLQEFGRLKAVDTSGLALYPDSAYELDDVIHARVFFREDLTLAGFKDYQPEVEEILARTLEQKHLIPSDAELLRRIYWLREVEKFGEHYGGPYFPYPDERYHIHATFQGEWLELYFDKDLALILAIKEERGVVWERPGARRPEVYRSTG